MGADPDVVEAWLHVGVAEEGHHDVPLRRASVPSARADRCFPTQGHFRLRALPHLLHPRSGEGHGGAKCRGSPLIFAKHKKRIDLEPGNSARRARIFFPASFQTEDTVATVLRVCGPNPWVWGGRCAGPGGPAPPAAGVHQPLPLESRRGSSGESGDASRRCRSPQLGAHALRCAGLFRSFVGSHVVEGSASSAQNPTSWNPWVCMRALFVCKGTCPPTMGSNLRAWIAPCVSVFELGSYRTLWLCMSGASARSLATL